MNLHYFLILKSQNARQDYSFSNRGVIALSLIDPINHRRQLSAQRSARYRLRQLGLPKSAGGLKPFIGLDGEGGGKDEFGRQHYLLMHAAGGKIDHSLFADNRPLSTAECLDFLLALPAAAILVGYFFTYDTTQIMRDVPEGRLRFLLDNPPDGQHKGYTYWGRYALQFVPRQYFRVALVSENGHGNSVMAGTARTVNEVGGFFQKSFVEAITSWNIGTLEERQRIAANKERRSEFELMGEEERAYCQLECKMLAQLMSDFRSACADAGITPAQWRGAGAIAAALYRDHNAPRAHNLIRPVRLTQAASAAYYGGRFEVFKLGHIPGPVYEYDINSAYPAAMLKLPCPLHTKWHRIKANNNMAKIGLYLADIDFDHPGNAPLCGFPVREKGRLFWPRRARGWYWSPEIEAAIQSGAKIVNWRGGWYAEKCCDCQPYAWVAELYQERQRLGKATRGYPLKLGINALYGKLAQRLGGAPYRDMIAAGLITAITRAQLIEACRDHEHAIVMLATDAVYSTEPLTVCQGGELGQWEAKTRAGMFVVQPGIYWSPGSDELPRTRGIPRSRIIGHRARFEATFDRWIGGDGPDDAPSVAVELPIFIGHRLALARNKPQLAGCWLQTAKNISFDWGTKRERTGTIRGRMIETMPFTGSFGLRSESYDPLATTDFADQQLETEAADDYEPWGNSDE